MHSEETRARWRSMVPAQRNYEPYELKAVSRRCSLSLQYLEMFTLPSDGAAF
jgi:hypothetical protein